MDEHVLYTVLAKYYDHIYRDYLERIVPRLVGFAEEVFRHVARREVRDVLDLACGTGGPTLELARRGYRVVGLDLHEEMLAVARRKAGEAGLSVEFVQGDARSLGFEEEFDAATMFFTSISYMAGPSDLDRLLRGVHRALRPGGVFVADAPNPHAFFEDMGRRPGAVAWDVEAGGERLFMIDYREAENVEGIVVFKRMVFRVEPGGQVHAYMVSDKLRLYTASELIGHSLAAGFSKALIYGDYKLAENPRSAKRLILAAVK